MPLTRSLDNPYRSNLSFLRPVQQALSLLWLSTLPLAWAMPSPGTPLAVSLLQSDGAAVQLRLRIPAGQEPVLHWPGTAKSAPYRLVLAWNDVNMTLDQPLPALPTKGLGPLQSLALQNTNAQARLEFQLSAAVTPNLRRVGDSWVLRLEPVETAPKIAPFANVAPSPLLPAAASATTQLAALSVLASTSSPATVPSETPVQPSVPLQLKLSRRLAQTGSTLKTTPEVLLVDVSINGQHMSSVVRTEQLPGGPLLLPSEAWAEARLTPASQVTALSDGTPAYALDAVPGVTYRINRQNLSLAITAPAAAFTSTSLNGLETLSAAPTRSQPGVLLNYDLSASNSRGGTASGAVLEAVAFNGFGNFVTSALFSGNSNGTGRVATRLDSYWHYDLPQRMESLTVGDTVGVGGGWSRPARYGGVRWGRDFGMRPGFITLPQISLAGEATLPSTVDVLVNNARRISQSVQPGPFDLVNVPLVTGAGEIGLVVRDLLGRETIVRQSYYTSPRLLAPGLSDYSFEAGKLRTGYGLDSSYGDTFGAVTWRQGLTSSLTGEARVELQEKRHAAGVELSGLLGTWGIARFALASSGSSIQGPYQNGQLLQVGMERSTPQGGGSLQYEYASRGFAPFGEASGSAAVAQRARERWLASLGGPLWGAVSGGVSYVRQTRWDGDRVQWLGLSMSMPLLKRATMSASVNKRLDGDQSWRAGLSFNLPLDGGINIANQFERGADGKMNGAVSAAANAPAGPGLGWRVQAATTESQRAQAALQYNTSHSEWALDAVASANGQVSTRLGNRGTVGWLEGMAFASRPVGQGSVAVVKVDGLAGIPVKLSHQVVAETDARGLAFVPGLLPWQKNQLEIDPVDLPLDVEVANTSQEVIPFARSGVVVNFAMRRTRQALLVLNQRDGSSVPMGAKVQLLPAGSEFITGRRGEVWLTDLAEKNQRIVVNWPKGGCTLNLDVPASLDGTPGKIGPLACEEGKP